MAEEIAEKRKLLSKLEQDPEDRQTHLRNYEEIRSTLLSLNELVKDAEPSEIINLISTMVERVYVARDGREEICHIYIKSCVGEDYFNEKDLFFRCSGTLKNISNGESTSIFKGTGEMCDSDECRESGTYQNHTSIELPMASC